MAEEAVQEAGYDQLDELVLASSHVGEFLHELAVLAAAELSHVDSEVPCGITLVRHKKADTVASSDERARAMDEVQYKSKDGPCLSAIREGTTVHVPDLTKDPRWPDYGAAVGGESINSVLAVPFRTGGSARAALNLYADASNAFTEDAIQAAAEFALRASTSLRLALRIAHLTDTRDNLTAAMESRTVIDLATGAIMAQNRCSQQTALAILKSASSSRNVKLRAVAATVLASISNEGVSTYFDA